MNVSEVDISVVLAGKQRNNFSQFVNKEIGLFKLLYQNHHVEVRCVPAPR